MSFLSPPFLSRDAISRPAPCRAIVSRPGAEGIHPASDGVTFHKEACLCSDDRDPVPFNSRRAGILPVGPAPDYLRQEGG